MRTLTAVLGLTVLLAGCGSLPPVPPRYPGTPYLLDTGDQIKVTVYSDTTLSQPYSVNDQGMIAVPLVGEIPARRRSVEDVTSELRTRLNDGLYKNVGLSAEVSQYRPVFLVGEINKPGAYPYVPDLTTLSAVSLAGGFTIRANEENFTVFRKIAGVQKEYRATAASDVEPGDVIVVREQFF